MDRTGKMMYKTLYILIFILLGLLAHYIGRTVKLSPSDSFQTSQYREVSEIDNKWALFLVNDSNPLPDAYSVSTVRVTGEYALDARAAPYLAAMLEAARNDGVLLNVISAYRSLEYQQGLFERSVREMMEDGLTQEQATQATAREIAPPGTSEHNAGIAVDIVSMSWYTEHKSLLADFDETEEFAWLVANCYRFGFILRYPKDKSDITGIIYEPWHYRFVGEYHATQIMRSGVCLEEYLAGLY